MGETDRLMYPRPGHNGTGQPQVQHQQQHGEEHRQNGGLGKDVLEEAATVVFFPARVPERSMSRMPADWTNRVLAK